MSNYKHQTGLSTEDYQKCQAIWRFYKTVKTESEVIRSGFGMYGVYHYNMRAVFDLDRSESDLEHVMGMQILVTLVSLFFPVLLSREEKDLAIYTTLVHEAGERIFGDIPDDGNRDEARKNQVELQAVRELVAELPAEVAARIGTIFMEMQQRSSRLGQFLYCAGKVEAILQGLIYESEGRGGDISVKMAVVDLSQQDKRGIERSNSKMLVDIWSVHFFDVTKNMYASEIFTGILRAAMEDVRGAWFAWLEQ